MVKESSRLEDIIVADVLERWPETIPVFLSHRLDCIGCDVAPFETVGEVISTYHLQASTFLADLQGIVAHSSSGHE